MDLAKSGLAGLLGHWYLLRRSGADEKGSIASYYDSLIVGMAGGVAGGLALRYIYSFPPLWASVLAGLGGSIVYDKFLIMN
jgi:hypothetical protein